MASLQTGGTVYVSALITSGGFQANTFNGLSNFTFYNGADEKFGFGAAFDGDSVSSFYGSYVASTNTAFNSTTAVLNNATAFLVGRIDLDLNIANFWVNPDVSVLQEEPSYSVSGVDMEFNRVRIESNVSSKVDEFRLGTTFTDVGVLGAIPEPSSALLLSLLSLTALRRRR